VTVLWYKPSYADAVLAYFTMYPPLYLRYMALRVMKEGRGGERALEVALDSVIVAILPLMLSRPFTALREAGWWREWSNWLIYLDMSSFISLAVFHALKSARDVHVDYGGVVDALASLSALHLVYAFAALFTTPPARPNVYRLLLWYFAIYPTALAVAAVSGGARATAAAVAIYLAAYALNAESLLQQQF